MRYYHIYSLVIKEFLILFRDPKSRIIMIMPPLMQLFIFAFAATLEVKNVNIAVLNYDHGEKSQFIIERCRGTKVFRNIITTHTPDQFQAAIDNQKALLGITFQQDFSKNILSQQPDEVMIILDGRRSNAAQIVAGYLNQIINDVQSDWQASKGIAPPLEFIERNWFNPNLVFLNSTIPALVGILSMLISLIITSLSVARERELGTFDQLLVSPLQPHEILIGKTIPAILVGLSEGLLIWSLGIMVFNVPFRGSLGLLILTLLMFITCIVGVGLFISGTVRTQQQAILGTFLFMVPAVTLSGYASPIENMPLWLQYVTWFNPLAHAMVAIKGLFLKNMSFGNLLPRLYPLAIISAGTLSLAAFNFAKKLE